MHVTGRPISPTIPATAGPHRVVAAVAAAVQRTPLADRLGLIAVVLAAVASAGGLFALDLYRDTAEGIRQARATDLVTLGVAVPAVAIGLWRARSGSAAGRVVAIGALGYLAYSYAIYAFSVVIDPLTPVHIAIFGLATWSMVLMVFGPATGTVGRASRFRFARRATGGFLIGVAALFAMLWLSLIAGAITSGRLPASVSDLQLPTSPVFALDLAFAVPLITLAGVRLIRRDHRGPASAAAALAFLAILGLSVLAIFAFEAAAGVSVDLVPIVLFGLVTTVAALTLALAVTGGVHERAIANGTTPGRTT